MVCITIVDDSPLDLMLIAGLLKTNPEYHVGFAKNGRDALEKITGAPPHLVITDLIMPEMDGFEFVREMDKRCTTWTTSRGAIARCRVATWLNRTTRRFWTET